MQQNMTPSNDREKILIEKIRTLSPKKIKQVVDFIYFISQKDSERRLIQTANRLAEPAFKKVWNNPEDDIYVRQTMPAAVHMDNTGQNACPNILNACRKTLAMFLVHR